MLIKKTYEAYGMGMILSKKNAEIILDSLEKAGMMPPEVNWNAGNGAGIPSYCTNEWEPEYGQE